MAGRDSAEPTVRFSIDPRLRAPGEKAPTDSGAPAPTFPRGPRPLAEGSGSGPATRDHSFQISGGMTYPGMTSPSPPSSPPAASPSVPSYQQEIVPRLRKARRPQLCHITARIPKKLLEKIDRAALEKNLGRSDIIRSVLLRAKFL
jgi:Ribbon-helix-helix protein, copG family